MGQLLLVFGLVRFWVRERPPIVMRLRNIRKYPYHRTKIETRATVEVCNQIVMRLLT